MGRSSVMGWGINDAPYDVVRTNIVNGKRQHVWMCAYYAKWSGMVKRCKSAAEQKKHPHYSECEILEEWKYFSNFKRWVDEQPNRNWENCHLDKDILIDENKLYSSYTCVFISSSLNAFVTDNRRVRGSYSIGVSWHKASNKFISRCSNPFNTGENYIGVFPTEIEAHKAWQAKKHEYACQLAELQDDQRVAQALRERYAPDKDWTKR